MLAATRRGPTPCWLHQVCSRTRQHARAHSLPFFPSFPTHADPYLTPLSPIGCLLSHVPVPLPHACAVKGAGFCRRSSLQVPGAWPKPRADLAHAALVAALTTTHATTTYRPVAVLRCTPTAASARLRAVCDSAADCSLVAWRAPAPNPNPIHTFDLYGSRVSLCTTFALYKQSANST